MSEKIGYVQIPSAAVRLWRLRAWNRNPLMRKADRVLSAAVLFAVLTSLLTVPIALAVGTATGSREASRLHARDDGKIAVTATVITVPVYDRSDHRYVATVRWKSYGHEREDIAPVGNFASRGGQTRIWLAADGSPVAPPAPRGSARLYAIGNGIGAAAAISAPPWIAVAILRSRIERRSEERLWRQHRALIRAMR